jgi:signal transduction histidine kinase
MREAIDDGESVQVTIRNYRKDGTRFWNEITLAPIQDEDGEIRHYAGFQQDATERKEYERRLQEQRDDLDLLNQMLQHDIRNDLHSMIANARLLEEHVTEEGRGRLEEIEQSVKEAVSLADTARDLSATMLAENPERRPISLSESLGSEIDDVESTFDDVVTEIDGSIPDVTIEADDLVNSVFRNLLRNAVQHNDTDVPKLTVSATRTDDHVQVRIADNGPGIPDERKDEIFGRGHTGLDSDGTGIGTYLVDTLVRRYGGEVWIEDNDPSGAIFVVQLPVAE